MITIDLITDLCCRIDDRMNALPKHPQATLWPNEVVTLGVLHTFQGVGNRAFHRWLTRDYQPLFPTCPSRPGYVSSVQDPSAVDLAIPGAADPVGHHGQLRHRTDPSDPGRPEPGPDRWQGAL